MREDLDYEIQEAFGWVMPLHGGNSEVAAQIVFRAYDSVSLIPRQQAKRWQARLKKLTQMLTTGQSQFIAQRPHTMKIPEDGWLQLRTMQVSELEEVEQEQRARDQGQSGDDRYQPGIDVLCVRYVKFLVWKTIVRNSCYVATGLGGLLYQYSPRHVSDVTFGLFEEDDISHVKDKLLKQIKERFPSLPIDTLPPYGETRVRMHCPNDHERKLVLKALKAFMPSWLPRIPHLEPVHPLLRDNDPAINHAIEHRERKHMFTWIDAGTLERLVNAIEHREWKRMFAWLDAGTLERLVGEFKEEVKDTTMWPKDPGKNLGIPSIDPPSDESSPLNPSGGGSPLDPDDLFNPSPLSDEVLAVIKEALGRNKRRRAQYRSGLLRVCIDGKARVQLFPGATSSHTLKDIPSDAAFLEIVGRDLEGDLPLATFPLLGLEMAGDNPQKHRFTASMGKQRVKIEISPHDGEAGEVRDAHITYTEKTRIDPWEWVKRSWEWVKHSGWRYVPVSLAAALLPGLLAVHLWRVNTQLTTSLHNQTAKVALYQDLSATRLFQAVPATLQRATTSRLQALEARLPKLLHGSSDKMAIFIGHVFMYGQQWQASLTAFERAEQLNPKLGEAYKAQAAIYQILGKHEKAIEKYQAFLAKQPHDPDTWNFLGWSFSVEGRLAEARHAYEQALGNSKDGFYPDALFNLSLLEEQEGNESVAQDLQARARQLLEAEIATHPNGAEAYFHLAKVSTHLGDWDPALYYLKISILENSEFAFWGRHDPFIEQLSQARPEVRQLLDEWADVFRINKVEQMLNQLS